MIMIETLQGTDFPEHLRELAERHKRHLAELITLLRTVGMDENAIEEAVDQLIADYRVQLLEAAKILQGVS